MPPFTSVTVYCASSPRVDPTFIEPAQTLGRLLAEREITLIYGGGRMGLMGAVGRATREAGGRTIGIITEKLMTHEVGDTDACELTIVPTMRERKQLLIERAGAFIMLPGGIGTYEEFFETLVARQLGDINAPIGIVNTDGYFDPLVHLLKHGVDAHLIRPGVFDLLAIAPQPEAVLDALLASDAAPAGPSW